jgi:hypothetical protein
MDGEYTTHIHFMTPRIEGKETRMRYFWSVVLAGGLLLVGLDAYQSRRDGDSRIRPGVAMAEDGSPFPPPPPPPPR